jgi:hypothetical protein
MYLQEAVGREMVYMTGRFVYEIGIKLIYSVVLQILALPFSNQKKLQVMFQYL